MPNLTLKAFFIVFSGQGGFLPSARIQKGLQNVGRGQLVHHVLAPGPAHVRLQQHAGGQLRGQALVLIADLVAQLRKPVRQLLHALGLKALAAVHVQRKSA